MTNIFKWTPISQYLGALFIQFSTTLPEIAKGTNMTETSPGWDYVIVGAGAAGATLAARLTENPAVRVLLLEAGPDRRPADRLPIFREREIDLDMTTHPDYWWPNLHTRRSPTQEVAAFQAGTGVGGTTEVNGLFAIRGTPADFARWVELGAAGWSFDEVLPFYRKLEDDLNFPDEPYHGKGGPIGIYREPVDGWGGVDLAFREAVLDVGAKWHPDFNAPNATGLSPFAMNIRDGRRVTVNDGYLEPARGRSNLTIRAESLVDTVVFAPGTTRTTGVRLADGEFIPVNPGGEVILSAGGSLSPAILVRSGIGWAADLQRLGVPVRADLPVGRDATEHPFIVINLPVLPEATLAPHGRTVNAAWRYNSGLADAGDNDMMIIPNNLWIGMSGLCIWQQHAVSHGELTFVSTDPKAGPLVEYRMLTEHSDLIRAQDALERVKELVDRPAFKAILDGTPEFLAPEDLPNAAMSSHHLASTVRMGAPGDATTVVDPECRVLGVEGLRVIDQSIMPEVIRGNTMLTVIMIAERMAGRIVAAAN